MTIRTFWTVFIKILGLWLVLESITVIPQFISALAYTDSGGTSQNLLSTTALLVVTIGIYLLILRLFVFKTAWIIDKLHLDKGFDEERIDLTIQYSTVLRIAVIVIGGLMFIDSLPQLCRQIFVFFQQENVFRQSPASGWIIFHLLKTLCGYLLMMNSKQVVIFIIKQAANEDNGAGLK